MYRHIVIVVKMGRYLECLGLLALLVVSGWCRLGASFYPIGLPPTTFQCMINSGFHEFSTYGFFENSVPGKGPADLAESHKTGADTNVIFKPCRGHPVKEQV